MAAPAYISMTGTKQGLITAGQRVHKPVKITKVFNKFSLLLAALTSGERPTEITLFTPSQNPF